MCSEKGNFDIGAELSIGDLSRVKRFFQQMDDLLGIKSLVFHFSFRRSLPGNIVQSVLKFFHD